MPPAVERVSLSEEEVDPASSSSSAGQGSTLGPVGGAWQELPSCASHRLKAQGAPSTSASQVVELPCDAQSCSTSASIVVELLSASQSCSTSASKVVELPSASQSRSSSASAKLYKKVYKSAVKMLSDDTFWCIEPGGLVIRNAYRDAHLLVVGHEPVFDIKANGKPTQVYSSDIEQDFYFPMQKAVSIGGAHYCAVSRCVADRPHVFAARHRVRN